MPSFDIVCELDLQEVDNAVNQAQKEVATRYDFRGGQSSLKFEREKKSIQIIADDDMKLKAIHQILESKLQKRDVDSRALTYGKEEDASGNLIRQTVSLISGLDKDNAKKVTKIIKDSKLKVQAQIQDDQVRVTGKKIDDLQEVIGILKNSDVGLPLQYVNMRS
ncbi:MAG: YajQ family cyclic di-GMP-binding protein [Bdellovibrionota bacterium]